MLTKKNKKQQEVACYATFENNLVSRFKSHDEGWFR